MKHVNISVIGKVQGVGFRQTTKFIADQMGINGFVRNEADGSVYMEIEGDEISVEEMINWCYEGPDRAIVEQVNTQEAALVQFQNFNIMKR